MTKGGPDFDPTAYAPVAERIRLFYERHPLGRIETELVSRDEHEVLFKALVFRDESDTRPAATGWASEREGDGEVNLAACLENTETSAVGRALANLGFTASRQRPSREEMEKAQRARSRLARAASRVAEPAISFAPTQRQAIDGDPLQRRANEVADALSLVRTAERLGLRPRRAEWLRRYVVSSLPSHDARERLIGMLRHWIAKRRDEALRIV
jgi:hypothetical protein